MSKLSQSQYLADRASAARLLRDSATAPCAFAVHDSFARLYDERGMEAGVQEAALLAQAQGGERRLALGLEPFPSRAVVEDDRWIGEGGSVLASRLAPVTSYGERPAIGFLGR